ncbi:MAG: hypothetical protein FWE23_10150 [Chitinivibrionia bacterium]|nr:hypothetical protein [Chitinivibrionia bacterium]
MTKNDETKSSLEWLSSFKDLWEKEEKLVKALLKFVVKVIKLSLKILKPSKIEFNLSGGFEDPAETGWLSSVFLMINSFFEDNNCVQISFAPNFIQKKWRYSGSVAYNFSIARLLLFVLSILFFIPYLKIIGALWRNRKYVFRKKK